MRPLQTYRKVPIYQADLRPTAAGTGCSNPLQVSIKAKAPPGYGGAFAFMDLEGFEPLTSRMRTERSPN